MIRNSLILVIMGLVAEASQALSLGAPQGKVWLGQPIDLSFEVQLDPGMAVDDLCPQVRLVSGDMAVPAGRVQVSVRPGEQERNPVLRVQSSHLADEPVLTAQVSVQCAGRVTREYTLLADLPATVAAGARPVAIPWNVPVAELPPARAGATSAGESVAAPEAGPPRQRRASVGARAVRKVTTRLAVKPASTPLASGPSSEAAAVSAASPGPTEASRAAPAAKTESPPAGPTAIAAAAPVAPAAAPAAPGPTKPRLVMEPLAALVTPPASGEAAPSEGAGSPQATSSAPEGNAPDGAGSNAARMQALQVEVDRMRAQAEQDRHATLALLARMEQLNAGHFPASLVYGLLVLLALTVGVAGWVVMRMRRAMDASNEEWRNTLTAYAAQSSLSAAGEGEPEHRAAASPPAEDRPTGLTGLQGTGALPA
ncbi:hypothetical protein [Acidovorax sp. Root70]|uniref:hypothetical protein n=1 Tax=Acidovorax sp. Root70 TaxID=1736590 RepID=UPI000A7F13F1|nr:hypothetical protein [Acidovorax sp. Root70]